MAPLDRSIMSTYWRSIVTIALSRMISDMQLDVGRKSLTNLLLHLAVSTHYRRV